MMEAAHVKNTEKLAHTDEYFDRNCLLGQAFHRPDNLLDANELVEMDVDTGNHSCCLDEDRNRT